MSGRSSRRRNDGEGGGNMMAEMLPNLLMGAMDLMSKHNQTKKRDRQRQHRHRREEEREERTRSPSSTRSSPAPGTRRKPTSRKTQIPSEKEHTEAQTKDASSSHSPCMKPGSNTPNGEDGGEETRPVSSLSPSRRKTTQEGSEKKHSPPTATAEGGEFENRNKSRSHQEERPKHRKDSLSPKTRRQNKEEPAGLMDFAYKLTTQFFTGYDDDDENEDQDDDGRETTMLGNISKYISYFIKFINMLLSNLQQVKEYWPAIADLLQKLWTMQDGSMEMKQESSKELVKLIVGPDSFINGVAEYGTEALCHLQNAGLQLIYASEELERLMPNPFPCCCCYSSHATISHQQARVSIIGAVGNGNNVTSTVANYNYASEDDLMDMEFTHLMNALQHVKNAMPHYEKALYALRPSRYRQCVMAYNKKAK